MTEEIQLIIDALNSAGTPAFEALVRYNYTASLITVVACATIFVLGMASLIGGAIQHNKHGWAQPTGAFAFIALGGFFAVLSACIGLDTVPDLIEPIGATLRQMVRSL